MITVTWPTTKHHNYLRIQSNDRCLSKFQCVHVDCVSYVHVHQRISAPDWKKNEKQQQQLILEPWSDIRNWTIFIQCNDAIFAAFTMSTCGALAGILLMGLLSVFYSAKLVSHTAWQLIQLSCQFQTVNEFPCFSFKLMATSASTAHTSKRHMQVTLRLNSTSAYIWHNINLSLLSKLWQQPSLIESQRCWGRRPHFLLGELLTTTETERWILRVRLPISWTSSTAQWFPMHRLAFHRCRCEARMPYSQAFEPLSALLLLLLLLSS